MRYYIFFWLLVGIHAIASPVALSFKKPELSIREDSNLSDVLYVRSSDRPLSNRINTLPLPNWKRNVKSEDVIYFVKSKLDGVAQITWRGEKRAKIKDVRVLKPQTIQNLISDETTEWVKKSFGNKASLKWFYGNPEITVNGIPTDMTFSLDEVNSNSSVVVGDLIVKVKGQLDLSVRIRYGLSVYVPVLKAICSISKGAAITEDCLERAYKQVQSVDQQFFQYTEHNLTDIFALKNIHRDQIITSDLVRKPSLVEAGDRVIATYIKNGVKIDSIAIAGKAGNAGQKINVSIRSIGANLPATVKVKGRVFIDGY